MNILDSNDLQQLKKTARMMGLKTTNTDTIKTTKEKIATALGDLGYDNLVDTNATDDMKEKAKASAIEQIMSGRAEVAGLSPYPTDIPHGQLPKLMPFQTPWGGRRRRIRRLRMSENDQQILFIHWNGYPFVLGLEADYADVPYPHWLTIKNGTSDRLRQKKRIDEEGRSNYENTFYTVNNFPVEDLGVTPGTGHLPRSLQEYMYAAYVEGFPNFTPTMWKLSAQAFGVSDKALGIVPTMTQDVQVRTRRTALLDKLGLHDVGDKDNEKARKERASIIAQRLIDSPIAEAA